MAVKKITRRDDAAEATGGNFCDFGVDNSSGRLFVNRDGTREPIASDYTKIVTAATTLTAEDDGITLVANSTSSIVVTLPAVATCGAGTKFTLVVKGLTSSGGHAFSPNSVDKIMGNGLTKADDADLVCSAATDRIGDACTIVSDGVDGWFITGITGTWA